MSKINGTTTVAHCSLAKRQPTNSDVQSFSERPRRKRSQPKTQEKSEIRRRRRRLVFTFHVQFDKPFTCRTTRYCPPQRFASV